MHVGCVCVSQAARTMREFKHSTGSIILYDAAGEWYPLNLVSFYIKEAFIFPHFHRCISVYFLITGRPTSLVMDSSDEAPKFAWMLGFQSMRNLHIWLAGSRSIFVGFCSGKKQCLSQAIYFHISNFCKIRFLTELPLEVVLIVAY